MTTITTRAVSAAAAALLAGLALAACTGPVTVEETVTEVEVTPQTESGEGSDFDDAEAVAEAFRAAGGPCEQMEGAGEGPGDSSVTCLAEGVSTMIAVFPSHADAEAFTDAEGPAQAELAGAAVILGGNWVLVTSPEWVNVATGLGGTVTDLVLD